jgi:membrane-associated phospholipid phosphatase
LALNIVVLVATPIQGGHHVVDVLAGFAVAAIAVIFADNLTRSRESRSPVGIETASAQPLRQISP